MKPHNTHVYKQFPNRTFPVKMGPRLTLKLYFHYKGLSNIITLLLPRLSTDHLSLSTSETMSMRTNMNIQTCSTEFCEIVMTIKQHIMRRVA